MGLRNKEEARYYLDTTGMDQETKDWILKRF
jgi:hypothetical protein